MKDNDKIRIQHIIDAAEEAQSFVQNIEKDDFIKNRMIILSVIKDIEIIGEAASKISEETKLKYLDVPRKDIVGMRNRLIHGYFDVDTELVWNTVSNNLPMLLSLLKKL
jgi:uncharacterized protein with HEPN domain